MLWGSRFGIENGYVLGTGLKVIDKPIDLLDGSFASLRRDEVFYDSVAVFMKVFGSLFDFEEECSLHKDRY